MAILDNIQVLLKYKPDTDRQYLFRQRQLADVFSVTKKTMCMKNINKQKQKLLA